MRRAKANYRAPATAVGPISRIALAIVMTEVSHVTTVLVVTRFR